MNDPLSDHAPASSSAPWRVIVTDVLGYWERRRPLYNAVLAGVVLAHFWAGLPASKTFLTLDSLLGLGVLAVLANICYCAAYAADVFVQFSGFRAGWLRWLLLALGTVFAAALTRFFVLGLTPPSTD